MRKRRAKAPPHEFDNACDMECSCGYRRSVQHSYMVSGDQVMHWQECMICGHIIDEQVHDFVNDCDRECSCGFIREPNHNYKLTHDDALHWYYCTVCGNIDGYSQHELDNNCDTECYCGFTRDADHQYQYMHDKDAHWLECDVCKRRENQQKHSFENSCDPACDCGFTQKVTHKYKTPCQQTCDICGDHRQTSHTYGEYVYNFDATTLKDGTKTRTCIYCPESETVVAPKTKLIDTSVKFKDIPQKGWYKQYTDFAVTHGIFGGKSATAFEPETSITRAEFVQVLANISKVDTTNKKISTKFKDVKSGQWYAPAVKWASDNKIVSGKSADTFDPNAKITREEMCVMLVNYASFSKITLDAYESVSSFADDKKISSWAKDRVYICRKAGLVNGKGGNKFDPSGTAIRAEAATIFTLFFKEYLK